MRQLLTVSMLAFGLLAFTSCGRGGNNLDKPREFFARNKIGSSPDYAVMKPGNDHVATVHGFVDSRRESRKSYHLIVRVHAGELGAVRRRDG